jgi:hypothetical protein
VTKPKTAQLIPSLEPEPRFIGGVLVQKAQALNEPKSIMIVGHPKRGKSTLGASLIDVPGYSRLLAIDVDGGCAGYAEQYPNVDVVAVDYGDATTVGQIIVELAEDPTGAGYDGVMLDTISVLQDWKIEEIGRGRKLEWDQWDQVAKWTNKVMWLLHSMKPLGLSIYHIKTEKDELTREVWKLPKIRGSAKDTVATVPDLIIEIRIVDTNAGPVRVVDCVPHETATTGNRYRHMPTTPLSDANMTDLFSYIRHERTDVPTAPSTAAERFAASPDSE